MVTNSIVQIQLLACRKHQKTEVWKFCLASFFPFSTLPRFFFWHLFFFIFLLRKTDRSGASFKVNGKAAFSPARYAVHACHSSASSLPPFPPSPSILVLLFSLLHPSSIFSLLLYSSSSAYWDNYSVFTPFPVYSLYVKLLFYMIAPDLVID